MKTGAELIAQERAEHTSKHNWLPEHDAQHTKGELRKVAAILAAQGTDAYVKSNDGEFETGKNVWRLEEKYKNDVINRLVVAGALIAAEIDRIQSGGN